MLQASVPAPHVPGRFLQYRQLVSQAQACTNYTL